MVVELWESIYGNQDILMDLFELQDLNKKKIIALPFNLFFWHTKVKYGPDRTGMKHTAKWECGLRCISSICEACTCTFLKNTGLKTTSTA